jgi:hypothetical protein
MGRLLRTSNCIGYLLVILALCCGELRALLHEFCASFLLSPMRGVCLRYDMIGDVIVFYICSHFSTCKAYSLVLVKVSAIGT